MNKESSVFEKLKELLSKKITREIVLYGIFGVMTTVINIVAYKICYDYLSITNVISTAVAWFLSVAFAYITNKIWVFESKEKNALKEALEFFLCRGATGVLDVIVMFVSVDIFGLPGVIMKILSNVLVIVINYVASKLFIFKNK